MMYKLFLFDKYFQNLPIEVRHMFSIFNAEEIDSIRLVGGCVRDLILSKNISDFDFATKFSPDEVKIILDKNEIRNIPTGIKYGTVTALINNFSFEVTTLRSDRDNNGRYPLVKFCKSYLDDAKRRDFTINALYLDYQGILYDFFNGIQDIESKKVKFIGDPEKRINEDFLRILRFFRFSVFYSKSLDELGSRACILYLKEIQNLSSDRIRNEWMKMFSCDNDKILLEVLLLLNQENISHLLDINILKIDHLRYALEVSVALNLKISNRLKFFILINDPSNDFQKIFIKFNFSNDDKKYYDFLRSYSERELSNPDNSRLIELLLDFKKDYVKDLYFIFAIKNNIENKIFKKNIEFINSFTAKEFPVNGNDLITIGYNPNKNFREILDKARRHWIENECSLNRDEVIKYIKETLSF